MDFTVIINRLNQLTSIMNSIIANSKKIFQLEPETAGEKFVAVWNSTTETTQKMNLSELIAYVNSINTRITNYGTIDRDVNEFTFNIGFEWIIEGISYANTSAVVHDIALAAAGENRIDIAVLNTSNGIDIVTGFETAGTAEQPLPPPNTILLKIFVVDDTSIDDINPPAITPDLEDVINTSGVVDITSDDSGIIDVKIENTTANERTRFLQDAANIALIGEADADNSQGEINVNAGKVYLGQRNVATSKTTGVGIADPTNNTTWKVPARTVDGDYFFAGKDEVKDIIYKSKVDSSAVTGTTSPVFPITITIPADRVSNSSIVKLKVRGRKTGTNGVFSLRCEGAIDAFFQTDNATRLGAEMEREFIIKGSVTEYPVYSQSLASPNGSINEFTQTAIDWTIDQDIDIGIELQNGSDSALISYIELYTE